MSSLEQDGFEIIPDVISQKTILSVGESLGESSMRRSRAGIRSALQVPGVRSLAVDEKLVSFARQALGERAIPFRATLFDKSALSNWLVVWHQDTALPLRRKLEAEGWGPWSVKDGIVYSHAPASALNQALALRVHLDDSTAQNGPLRVRPATHKLGILSDDEIL